MSAQCSHSNEGDAKGLQGYQVRCMVEKPGIPVLLASPSSDMAKVWTFDLPIKKQMIHSMHWSSYTWEKNSDLNQDG